MPGSSVAKNINQYGLKEEPFKPHIFDFKNISSIKDAIDLILKRKKIPYYTPNPDLFDLNLSMREVPFDPNSSMKEFPFDPYINNYPIPKEINVPFNLKLTPEQIESLQSNLNIKDIAKIIDRESRIDLNDVENNEKSLVQLPFSKNIDNSTIIADLQSKIKDSIKKIIPKKEEPVVPKKEEIVPPKKLTPDKAIEEMISDELYNPKKEEIDAPKEKKEIRKSILSNLQPYYGAGAGAGLGGLLGYGLGGNLLSTLAGAGLGGVGGYYGQKWLEGK